MSACVCACAHELCASPYSVSRECVTRRSRLVRCHLCLTSAPARVSRRCRIVTRRHMPLHRSPCALHFCTSHGVRCSAVMLHAVRCGFMASDIACRQVHCVYRQSLSQDEAIRVVRLAAAAGPESIRTSPPRYTTMQHDANNAIGATSHPFSPARNPTIRFESPRAHIAHRLSLLQW